MANLSVRKGEAHERAMPTRWDPFRMVERLWDPVHMMREMMGTDPFSSLAPGASGVFAPDIEVKETKGAYVIQADLPGVKEADLDVSVIGNRVTVSARREEEERREDDRYFAYERSYGSCSRSFVMPEGADVENVSANLKDGVLRIEVPKRAEMQPRRVELGRKGAEGKEQETAAPSAQNARAASEPKKAA